MHVACVAVFAQTQGTGALSVPTVVDETAIVLDEAAIDPEAVPSGPTIWTVLRMILVLAIAAAAVYGVVYFLRRIAKPQTQQDPNLKILASVHMGSNRFVHVVSVGTAAWLVGASDGGVNLIAEVADQEAIDTMLLEYSARQSEAGPSGGMDFSKLFSRFSGRGKPPFPDSFPPSADNLRKRRERIRGL